MTPIGVVRVTMDVLQCYSVLEKSTTDSYPWRSNLTVTISLTLTVSQAYPLCSSTMADQVI